MKQCPKCGFENQNSMDFCLNCGTSLSNSPMIVNFGDEKTEEFRKETETLDAKKGAFQTNSEAGQNKPPRNRSKLLPILGGIAALLVLLGIVGVAIGYKIIKPKLFPPTPAPAIFNLPTPSITPTLTPTLDASNSQTVSGNKETKDVTPKEAVDTTPITWDTTPAGFKGKEGQTYRFSCPTSGTPGTIYGSDIYTDDSSICTAAVHAGVISIERGGTVTIGIRPGQLIYGSTTRHGIKSNSYGEWRRSFVIKSSDTTQDTGNSRTESDKENTEDATPIAWDTTAAGFKGETGQIYKFRCPGQGVAGTVYGSDIYTDDSSICSAAVHVGVISLERGGQVTIEFRPGQSIYGSTVRHNIKSNSYGEWKRSFVIR